VYSVGVRTARVLRALSLLGLSGISLVLFVQGVFGPGQDAVIKSNAYGWDVRVRIIVAMGIAFTLAALGGALIFWRCGDGRVRWLSHRVAPLAALGFVPPLFHPAAWPDPLVAVVAIAAVSLLAERLLRLSFAADAELALASSPPRPLLGPRASARAQRWVDGVRRFGTAAARGLPGLVRRWGPAAFVAASAVAYAVYMSVFTLRMHGRFGTYGYDLGQMDNVFWSTLHGHPFHDAPLGLVDDWSELRNHADLSAVFFLPLYALKPGAPTLLLIQSCVLGLGAIPVYRFAARRVSRGAACLMAVAYLLYPPMHGLQFYDFHFQPIASTFVLLVIDLVDERRYWLCALAFVVALGCREDVSIGLAVLGAFLILSGHRVRAGFAIALVAGAYFVLMSLVIMPRLGKTAFGLWTATYIYKDLIPRGAQSISGVIASLLSNPAYVFKTVITGDKLKYALQILVPLGLLPLRRSTLAAALVHGSLLTLLTTGYGPTIDIGFQYGADFIPYIFPASVVALAAYGAAPDGVVRRRAALGAVVLGTVLCGVFWGAIPPRAEFHGGFDTLPMTAPTPADRQKHEDLQALHALVPAEASLAVSEHEMPHLSRLLMLSLRDTTDADYLLYATGSGYFGSDRAERALAAGEFRRFADRPGLVLLQRARPLPAPPP
jgi:uncharacterized membrane protein